MAQTVSELLSSEDRWLRGMSFFGPNRYCLFGALGQVYTGNPFPALEVYRNPEFEAVVRRVEATIHQLYPRNAPYWRHFCQSVSGFNDHPETTFEMVQEVIRVSGV